ncbi:MAG: oxidoreductase [Betaproteobacteria bacterium]|nr:MAG: oxidoreductase [Betaproteobacteria bacterium]
MTEAQTQPLSLIVESTREIARGIHSFELEDPAGAELPAFTAGAHIGLRVPTGRMRKYSLCNDPAERDRYVIAVKREESGSGGSSSLIDQVTPGDRLECTPPRNDFALSDRATSFLFIAGGIGITPILSMVRHLKSTASARFKLYYCTRTPEDTPFREELTGPDYRGRVVIHHDDGDPERLLDLWPLLERPTGAHVYCCGPRSMLEAVRDMTGHWSSGKVHFESFDDAAAMRTPRDRPFRVRLVHTGSVVDVPADQSILEALRAAGLVVPSSCESGTCGTCRTGLVDGQPDHRDLVLSDAERESNIMVCVSRALSDELAIDR